MNILGILEMKGGHLGDGHPGALEMRRVGILGILEMKKMGIPGGWASWGPGDEKDGHPEDSQR